MRTLNVHICSPVCPLPLSIIQGFQMGTLFKALACSMSTSERQENRGANLFYVSIGNGSEF